MTQKFGLRTIMFVLITALILSACGSPAAPAVATVETVMYADPILQTMYELAVSGNPQMTYSPDQYLQMFDDWYNSNSKVIYAQEFELASKNLSYVKSSEIIALKGGVPGWLYALAAWTVTTTVVAMNAEMAANLHLTTITLSTPPLKIVVPQSYSVTTTQMLSIEDQLLQTQVLQLQNAQIEQVEMKGKTATVLMTGVACIGYMNMSTRVYWYDENNQMQSKDFDEENSCIKTKLDPMFQMNRLYKQIFDWAKQSGLSDDIIKTWIEPYLDDILEFVVRLGNIAAK